MKKLILACFCLLGALVWGGIIHAQGISYQAVARNASGSLLSNQSISVRFTIREGSGNGPNVYEEVHTTSTNDYGLFSLVVGKGSTIGANLFEDINWFDNSHFLEVEVNGTNMGVTQLETVPYSKVATAMQVNHLTDVNIGAVAVNDVLKWNGSAWTNQPDAVNDADANPTNEIQSLSLSGNTLSLSQGGGSVNLPSGGSLWNTSGNNIYYNSGNVGVGISNPIGKFEVASATAAAYAVSFSKENAGAGNDVLVLRTQPGAPASASFIEMQRGATAEARINADGGAEFLNVTVEEDLNSTTSPTKGRLYANALPIAYGYVSSTTTSAGLVTDYGVASVTKPASTTGIYEITLNKTIVGNPVVIATSYSSGPDDEIVTASALSSTSIRINIVDGAGAAVNSNFYFVVFGTVQ